MRFMVCGGSFYNQVVALLLVVLISVLHGTFCSYAFSSRGQLIQKSRTGEVVLSLPEGISRCSLGKSDLTFWAWGGEGSSRLYFVVRNVRKAIVSHKGAFVQEVSSRLGGIFVVGNATRDVWTNRSVFSSCRLRIHPNFKNPGHDDNAFPETLTLTLWCENLLTASPKQVPYSDFYTKDALVCQCDDKTSKPEN